MYKRQIIDRFGPDKLPGIPGHQEVEIGLMRMYHATGNEAYKKQARYFLEERGKNPAFFAEEAAKRDWKHLDVYKRQASGLPLLIRKRCVN